VDEFEHGILRISIDLDSANPVKGKEDLLIGNVKCCYGALAPMVCQFAVNGERLTSAVSDYSDVPVYKYGYESEEEKDSVFTIMNLVEAAMRAKLQRAYPSFKLSWSNASYADEICFKEFKNFKKEVFNPREYVERPGRFCFGIDFYWVLVDDVKQTISFGCKMKPTATKWLSEEEKAEHTAELKSREVVFERQKSFKKPRV
jgi:hypothetical protein